MNTSGIVEGTGMMAVADPDGHFALTSDKGRDMIAHHHSGRILLAGGIAMLMVWGGTTYAFRRFRTTSTPPAPTLPQAYEQATQALGAETNSFYCLSASAMEITDSSSPTEWHLLFYATNGQFREVVVPTTGKVMVRPDPMAPH